MTDTALKSTTFLTQYQSFQRTISFFLVDTYDVAYITHGCVLTLLNKLINQNQPSNKILTHIIIVIKKILFLSNKYFRIIIIKRYIHMKIGILLMVSLLVFTPLKAQELIPQTEYYDSLKRVPKSMYTILPNGEKHGTEKIFDLNKKHIRTNIFNNGKIESVKSFFSNGLPKVEAIVAPEYNDSITFYNSYTLYTTNSRGKRIAEISTKLRHSSSPNSQGYYTYTINYGKRTIDIGDYRIDSYKQYYLTGKPRVEFSSSEDGKLEHFITYNEKGEINRDFTYNLENRTLIINKFEGYNWIATDSTITIKGLPFKQEDTIEEDGVVYKKIYNYPVETSINLRPVSMEHHEFYKLLTTINTDTDTKEYYLSIKETGLDNIRYQIINASGDTSGISTQFIGRRFTWEWQANPTLKWKINTVLLPNDGTSITDGTYREDDKSEWDIEATYKNGVLSHLKVKQHGDIVQGDIVNNKLNGSGSSKIWSELYVGEFLNNKRHGKGKLEDGQIIYIGGFHNGKKIGNGKLYSKNALKFFESYTSSMQNRQSFDISSYTFDGHFKDDEPYTGIESTILNSGDRVDMHIKNGELQGRGRYVWKDGNTFEGNDLVKYNGNGKLTLSNGDYYNGEFETYNEEFVQPTLASFHKGVVRITLQSNIIYVGEYNNGIEGLGKLILPNKNEFEGKFIGNQLDNNSPMKVKVHLEDGSIYEGAYVDEKITGPGKLTTSNGDVYEGIFKAGRLTTNPKIKVSIKKLDIPIVQLPN